MNRWAAIIASVGLHAAVLAVLVLWPRSGHSPLIEPPLVVDLVLASVSPLPLVETAPALSSPMPPAPVLKSLSPPPRARSKPTRVKQQQSQPVTTSSDEVPAPSEQASADGAKTLAPSSPSSGPGGNGVAGGGSVGGPPGYTLGSAHTPAPDYPWSARRRGIQGRVVIRLAVAADGRPTDAEIVQSSGDTGLDQAALITLRHWRLQPAQAGGVPVAGYILIPIVFKLT